MDSHFNVVESVEVAGQHDRRRRTSRRRSINAGLDVVKERRGLVLWLRRVVQRADKRGVCHCSHPHPEQLVLCRVTRTRPDVC